MSIILPKPSKGIKFDYVFSIDMNDFDVELLLPALSISFGQRVLR